MYLTVFRCLIACHLVLTLSLGLQRLCDLKSLLDSDMKGRTQCRRLPVLCEVWRKVSLSAKPYPHNMQRLGLKPETFQLQMVGSTAAPGPPFLTEI
jgi:hypothetical protein